MFLCLNMNKHKVFFQTSLRQGILQSLLQIFYLFNVVFNVAGL